MKKFMSRALSFAILFLVLVAAVPNNANAAYGIDFSYELVYDGINYGQVVFSGYISHKRQTVMLDNEERTWTFTDVAASSSMHIYPNDFKGDFIVYIESYDHITDNQYSTSAADDWCFTQILGDYKASVGYGFINYHNSDYSEFCVCKNHPAIINFGKNEPTNPVFGGINEFTMKTDGTLYIVWTEIYDENDNFVVRFCTPVYVKETPTEKATAIPTTSKIMVNGEIVSFDAYNIGGNNYFKLRDVANVINGTTKQFNVTWDNDVRAINMISNESYVAVGGEMTAGDGVAKNAVLTDSPIYLDGEQVVLTAYNINGNNYFKLRDLGQLFDFDVSWDNGSKTIIVDTTRTYTAD